MDKGAYCPILIPSKILRFNVTVGFLGRNGIFVFHTYDWLVTLVHAVEYAVGSNIRFLCLGLFGLGPAAPGQSSCHTGLQIMKAGSSSTALTGIARGASRNYVRGVLARPPFPTRLSLSEDGKIPRYTRTPSIAFHTYLR